MTRLGDGDVLGERSGQMRAEYEQRERELAQLRKFRLVEPVNTNRANMDRSSNPLDGSKKLKLPLIGTMSSSLGTTMQFDQTFASAEFSIN